MLRIMKSSRVQDPAKNATRRDRMPSFTGIPIVFFAEACEAPASHGLIFMAQSSSGRD